MPVSAASREARMLLLLLLLLLMPVSAKHTGIQSARLCCGSDCVDLADDYPDAWARRDQLGRHAQIFPRVRSAQCPVASVLLL